MKMPLVFALAIICASISLAQSNVKYAGTVVDAQGRPVAGATVDCYYSPASPDLLLGVRMSLRNSSSN